MGVKMKRLGLSACVEWDLGWDRGLLYELVDSESTHNVVAGKE